MYDYFCGTAKRYPKRTALIFFGRKISFDRLLGQIDKAADGFKKIGVKAGDCVTICLPNCPDAVVAFYALNRIGAICSMVHPFTPALLLRQIIEKTHSGFVLLNDFSFFRYKDGLTDIDIKIIICKLQTYMPFFLGRFFALKNRKVNKAVDYKCGNIIKYCSLLGRVTAAGSGSGAWQAADKTREAATSSGATQAANNSSDGENAIKISAAGRENADENIATGSGERGGAAQGQPPDLQPSVYLHSGGTTGAPKTVMLSDFNFNRLADRAFEMLSVDGAEATGDKIMFSALPMFHGFGLGVCVHVILSCGAASLLVPKFAPKVAVKAIKRYNANVFAGVPTMFAAMLNYKKFDAKHLKKVTHIFCGADALPQSLKQSFDKILAKNKSRAQLLEGYGLTETVTVCAVNTNENFRAGSVGRPLQGIEIRAFDTETGNICPSGTFGELCVRGDTVMTGYYADKAATACALKKHDDGDPFVHTGDYGFVDADGFVYFKQRLKRIVKISGVAIFPSEIEEAVLSLSKVGLACAVGVENEKSGATIRLYVVLKDGVEEGAEIKNEIVEACKMRLIKWAVPTEIVFEKSLPQTIMGKVDFRALEVPFKQ
jgi:long-chain acyl-CoA synthetase